MPGSADETGAAGYRPLLFSIAYGMTGSVGDAEDIVQGRNCSASGLAWLRKALTDLPAMAILEIGVFDEMGHRGKRPLTLAVRRHPVSPQWLRLSVLESDERLDGSAESLRLQQGWAAVITCTQASSMIVLSRQTPGLRDVP